MSFDQINKTYENLSAAVKQEYLEASHVLPFTGVAIKEAFAPDEISDVNKFMADMKAAAADNEMKAAAITRYSGVVVKLLGLAGVPV